MYTRAPISRDCVALDPSVSTGSPNFIFVIYGCTGTTVRIDVTTGAYQAGSCAVNGSPNVRKSLMQQVELGKRMSQQNAEGGSKQDVCATIFMDCKLILVRVLSNHRHMRRQL